MPPSFRLLGPQFHLENASCVGSAPAVWHSCLTAPPEPREKPAPPEPREKPALNFPCGSHRRTCSEKGNNKKGHLSRKMNSTLQLKNRELCTKSSTVTNTSTSTVSLWGARVPPLYNKSNNSMCPGECSRGPDGISHVLYFV